MRGRPEIDPACRSHELHLVLLNVPTGLRVSPPGARPRHGRHEQLFEKRGRYWQLLRRQQLEESLEEVR